MNTTTTPTNTVLETGLPAIGSHRFVNIRDRNFGWLQGIVKIRSYQYDWETGEPQYAYADVVDDGGSETLRYLGELHVTEARLVPIVTVNIPGWKARRP